MDDFRAIQKEIADTLDTSVVFLVGATRWGTAWVQQCLDAHPYVSAQGEGHFTDVLFPRVGEVLNEYNKACEKIGNRLQIAGLPGNAAFLGHDDIDHILRTAIGLMLRRWGQAKEYPPVVVVEKTPEHVVSLDILYRIIPNCRIIHVYRDGRDEAVSAWEFNLGLSRGEFPRNFPEFSDFVEVFAGNWSRAIDSARRFQRFGGGISHEIRAEDIVETPDRVARELFSFIGVDIDADWLKACTGTAWDIAPLDLEHGTWHDSFDERAERRFMRQAGELLKLLGYKT